MESKLAKQIELALVANTKCMTREQRLDAHLTHCRLMMDLYEAGKAIRAEHARQRNR
ncbi:MAG TPA: hypothetical protein VFY39_09415 [Gammaproteobacteria bacterium]|nr:hypothetical protein [Gammaproteobacteria bacterium]